MPSFPLPPKIGCLADVLCMLWLADALVPPDAQGDLALGERRMKRQSDGLNDKWVQKYRELKGRSSSK